MRALMFHFGKSRLVVTALAMAGAFCSAFSAAEEVAAPCDDKLGREVFVLCAACHALAAGELRHEGPSLRGVFGRKAATDPNFKYSPAMLAAKWTWDAATLDRFVINPRRALPGTLMSFPGLSASADRAAVICYLRQQPQ
jgi:cytochrome c